MASEMPIVPKAGQLWVHTGNIVNWNRLKKKLTQVPTEELSECISSTLSGWLEQSDRTELQYATTLTCVDKKFSEKLPKEEREDLKITVKIFLTVPTAEEVEESIQRVCEELGVTHLDTVLVSMADKSFSSLQVAWETLESYVTQEKIYSIGVADLDKEHLQELHDWAKVKPCIDQVNLESCCVMPAELTEYAKANDIQLLTHNDPKEILKEEKLEEIIGKSLTVRDAENWEPAWVIRYSVLFKCRGIIKAKGYIAKACRDIKKRK